MSDNDSSILTEEMFNKLYAYRYQYEEYNISEIYILKKLFKILINQERLTKELAVSTLRNFYLFNTFQITQSEINETLDYLVNPQNNYFYNYPPNIQNLVTRFPILNTRISQALNNNYIPLNQNDTNNTDIDSTLINNFNQNLRINIPRNINQPPYDQLSELPNIPELRIFNNSLTSTMMSNVINNPLLNNGIRHNAPAHILFSQYPRREISLSYTTNILENVASLLRNRIESSNNLVDIPIVLKENEFNELPKYKYQELPDEFKNNFKSCPISMQDYEDDTELVKLPCGHYFSVDFAKTWLLENSHKCPVCRASAGETKAKID
jgi:hypothetical protein